MVDEHSQKNPVPVLPAAGGKAAEKNPAPVSAPASAAVAVSQTAPVAAPPVTSPALFGGHKGGGKKRADGLVAGSPAAIEADRKKNAERMRLARAEKKSAEIPAALPSRAAAAEGPAGALGVGAALERMPLAFPQVPATPVSFAPAFVAWTQKLLEKPARLLVKISEGSFRFRARSSSAN